ncbi:MAG: AmmeMemoRadiSam system protein B [Chloroflexota bacterium]
MGGQRLLAYFTGMVADIRPKLRPLDMQWTVLNGRSALVLRDRQGISNRVLLIPGELAPLLAFMDGSRTPTGRLAFEMRTGRFLPPGLVEGLIAELDEAIFLEGPRLEAARRQALESFRALPIRPPALAGTVYPAEPEDLAAALGAYIREAGAEGMASGAVGAVSPHIDYQRGWRVYARLWSALRPDVEAADAVIIFGTDHSGGAGRLTLTARPYATPFGTVPLFREAFDALVDALGPEAVFEEELHHRAEHSVELALVWLHYLRREDPPPVLPVLCGHFYDFTHGGASAADHEPFTRTLAALRAACAGRRVFVVAAADLAHVGPAFGDPDGYDRLMAARLAGEDRRLLEAIEAGDAEAFLGWVRADRDRNKICGLPPIYLALRFLGRCRGRTISYEQCPADPYGTSLVSIAGVILEPDGS